ncbi:LON peptidase N-terminal domain and RING finger protein 2 [Sergentomyia squamirostris]
MAAEENQDLAEVKGDLSKVLRGIAILQTSVDCMAQSLLNPPLDLPVRSEDELDAAEEIIKTATDKRSIRGQLRKVVSEAGDNWLEKLLDPCLLLQYNVNYTKDSKCLMGLEIIALGRSFAKKNSKPDIVSALKRIKDRMKKRNKSQKKRRTAAVQDHSNRGNVSDVNPVSPEIIIENLDENQSPLGNADPGHLLSQEWGRPK